MLDKQSRKVLAAIHKVRKIEKVISSDHLVFHLPRYIELDILDSLEYLEHEGYVQVTWADDIARRIVLTYKGKHYNDFDRAAFKLFIGENILVPIIVSILTTVAALIIAKFLG